MASRLADDLRAKRFDVWLDRERAKAGASWTRSIEVAIDNSDVLLALLSKGSFYSDICRAEQLRALRKNKRVLPILLHKDADVPVHLEAGQYLRLYEGPYQQRLQQLQQAIEDASLTVQLQGRYKKHYRTYPPLPQHFVPRPQLLESIRQAIITERISGISVVAICGSGGIGKTVLAQAVCQDEAVQDAFPDGVLWANIGRNPGSEHLCEQIRELAKALGDTLEAYDTLQGSQNQLRNVLHDKSVLIVLDDVWDPNHVNLFNADAPRCCLLITTRSEAVASGANGREIKVELMEDHESKELLARKSGWSVNTLPQEAANIIQRCGGLPLALAMIGARARKGQGEWARILSAMDRGRPERISLKLSDYPYADLFETTRVSVDSLTAEQKSGYLDLAVFPPNTPVPQKVLETIWNLSPDEASDLIEGWVEASLASRAEGWVTAHDLQLDYVRSQSRDLERMHRHLLESYKDKIEGGWSRGPDDGYYFSHLAWHMLRAGEATDLRRLLLSSEWTRTKLERKGVAALIADFGSAPQDPNLLLIQEALQLSAHVLGRDPGQLASQAFGRLRAGASPEIQEFLEGIRRTQAQAWLEPRSPSLWRPGAVLVFTLASHGGAVKDLAIPPSGKRVISASDDQTLKFWNIETGAELFTLRGHSAPVNAVALTRDTKLAVSSSYDKTLRVWDLCQGKELRRLTGHSHLVNVLAITAGGRYVISASYDRTLKLWDLDSGTALHTFAGHLGWVNAISVTRDGRLMVSASQDQTLKVWNLETGLLQCTLIGHRGSVRDVVLTPDGKEAVSASIDKTIKIWNLDDGTQVRSLAGHSGPVNKVVVTASGRQVVSASQDHTVRSWDLNSGLQLQVLAGHNGSVNAILLMPGDTRVISASDDNQVKMWDLDSGTELYNVPAHSGPVHKLMATPDGKRVVSVNGSEDTTLRVWDFASQFDVHNVAIHSQMVKAVAISRDGGIAVSASSDKTLIVWRPDSGAQLHTLAGHAGAVNSVEITSDGLRAVSASSDKTLRIWDLQTGSVLHTLTGHSRAVEHVALTADGERAVSASSDGTLRVWDIVGGREMKRLAGHSGWVRQVAITTDGTRAVSASFDHTARIWDLKSGTTLRTLEGHESWMNAVAVSSRAHRVVSASYDHTLRVWDLESGAHIRTLTGHSASVSSVTVTPDGKRIVSASHDHTVRVWDLETGEPLRVFAGHARSVNAIAVSGDQRVVVSASNDNTVKVWTLEGKDIATFSADSPIVCLAVTMDGGTFVAGDYLGQVHLLRLHQPNIDFS